MTKPTETCSCSKSQTPDVCTQHTDTQDPVAREVPRQQLYRYLAILAAALATWVLIYGELAPFSRWFTFDLLRLAQTTRLGSAVQFFLFDAPKVVMLLVLIVFFVGIIRTFFTPARTRRILAGKRETAGNVLAAMLGIVTPFCSCSAVPLFIGFVTAGVPLGVTFSFLIAAPMVNEVALVLLYGLFGWKVAGLYLVTGLLIAMIAGWVIGRLRMEKHVESWVYETQAGEVSEAELDWVGRLQDGWRAVKDIVGKVWPMCSQVLPSEPLFTDTCRKASWPPSWETAPSGRCRSPFSSAYRCIRTQPG